MKLWFDSKMDTYVLDYFKKALEYEIGISHATEMVGFGTRKTGDFGPLTVSEYKLTAPQVNSAIKNLDRLLDLPVIDVNTIVSVASSNAQLFNTDESRDIVASIVTKAYENLRDIWKIDSAFSKYSVKISLTTSLILDFEGWRNDARGASNADYVKFYDEVKAVRYNDWDNVLSNSSSIATINENRYLIKYSITTSSKHAMNDTSFQSFRPNRVSLDEVKQLTKN